MSKLRTPAENEELQTLLKKKACFRYPIDGETEFDRAFRAAISKYFGAEQDNQYSLWVQSLRRNALIV